MITNLELLNPNCRKDDSILLEKPSTSEKIIKLTFLEDFRSGFLFPLKVILRGQSYFTISYQTKYFGHQLFLMELWDNFKQSYLYSGGKFECALYMIFFLFFENFICLDANI